MNIDRPCEGCRSRGYIKNGEWFFECKRCNGTGEVRSLLDDVIDRDLVIVWHDQDGGDAA